MDRSSLPAQRAFCFKLIFAIAFMAQITCQGEMQLPQRTDPIQFIRSLRPIPFRDQIMMLPPSLYRGLRSGRISPMLQFLLLNWMITSAEMELLQKKLPRRISLIEARKAFDEAGCALRSALGQVMTVGMLASTSQNPRFGGSDNPQEGQGEAQVALKIAQAFQGSQGKCQGQAFDPNLMASLNQAAGAQGKPSRARHLLHDTDTRSGFPCGVWGELEEVRRQPAFDWETGETRK